MWWTRLLNRFGFRKDSLICMRQENTWRWSSHLGKKTEGKCCKCDASIYFEKQNSVFVNKICDVCIRSRIL